LSSAELEIKAGEYTYLPIERVHFGAGSIAKLGAELDKIGSEKPFVITGHTIASKTDLVRRLEHAAGRNLAGVYSGIRQHAPQSGIEQATKEAIDAKTDSLISLGGGSPIDSTKIVVKEISENFHLEPIYHIAVPTTLSAAEFSHAAGMTDESIKRKIGFRDIRLVPRTIFLDPELTVPTPGWLWASTGIRSLDHAVEAVYSPRHQPFVDTLALEAIRILFTNLKRSIQDPIDLKSRLACQIGAWMSDAGALSVGTGISHSIGRVIGATWNIPHGITSCLTLAEVMRMEAKRNPQRLIPIAGAEGKTANGPPSEVAMSAVNGVAELVRDLGLSKRLRDYGIKRDDFPSIAREAGGPEQVAEIMKILETIW
jgi:alcohol dehydrogenase class IV